MSGSIVCGIDGSQESLAAATVAARLAERLGSRLVLAHVLEASTRFPYGHEFQAERRWRRAGGRVTSLFERIERRLSEVEADRRVLHGAPARALQVLAAEEEAALLVVGSRGRGALTAAVLGSVSSAVAQASDGPVVIVPPNAAQVSGSDQRDRSTVVCGVDGSDEAKAAARVAARLAGVLGLELVLVHAYEPGPSAAAIPAPGVGPPIDQEALDERQREGAWSLLEAVARDIEEAPTELRVELGAAASALDRSAQDEHAELIMVGGHGWGPLSSGLLGSTSARLAACASRPVVVVPQGASLPLEKTIDAESGRLR